MAARAYWKGHLRLSLVTIGVELYSAVTQANRLTFHQIHRPSEKRIRYQKVAPGVGPVDPDEIVKGYEIDPDNYVLVEPEELDAIKLESRHTIDLVQFVDHCEIDPRYFNRPYYVVPAETEVALEGFSVIRDALRQSERVGLGQMASRGRDYVVAIKPCGVGLLLETLRYAEEIRESERIFAGIEDIDVEEDMLSLATELIDRKSAPFDAQAFKSQYVEALRELIEEKRATGDVAAATDEALAARRDNVVDLMDALKKSVGRDRKSSGKKAAKKSTSKKSVSKKAASKSSRSGASRRKSG